MHKTLLFLFLSAVLTTQAQNFGLPVKDLPYFDVIEWKGQGGLLRSRSPKDILNQIGMTLVGELSEGKWDQKFNPKTRDPYYLCAENTRYVYFIDNLDPINNGNMTFNQINSAGNIKTKSLDIGLKVKMLPGEHDYNKFELVDAGVTDKALLYLFRYFNKKEKEYYDFAVFMTHHNLQHLVFQLGKGVDQDLVEKHINGQWQFAGFNGELNYLAWRTIKTDVKGSVVKGFNTKGEMIEDHFIFEPEGARPFLNIGYGTTGKYYIQNEERYSTEYGVVSFIDGKFYFTCILDNKVVLMERDNDHWEPVNSAEIGSINETTDRVRMGAYAVKEGVIYHYKHNGTDKVGILYFEKGKQGEQENFSPISVYNPSRLLLPNSEEEFVTEVGGKILVCNLSQFKNSGTGIQFFHR